LGGKGGRVSSSCSSRRIDAFSDEKLLTGESEGDEGVGGRKMEKGEPIRSTGGKKKRVAAHAVLRTWPKRKNVYGTEETGNSFGRC